MDTVKQRHATRLEALNAKLQGSTGPDGKALPGYEERVALIRAEIARLAPPSRS